MLEIIIFSSVVGYVYAEILLEEHKPLHWWYKLVEKHLANKINWLYYLLNCSLCMSGQIALWTFIFTQKLVLTDLVFTICGAILLTKFIQKWS